MKAPIYILLIVLVTSCNKTIDIKDKTLYSDLDHAPSIPTEKLFSKIEVIPLETQEKSIIRGIDKIMEYQSCIYILDRRQKAVLIFDGYGKFISKINSIGRAPDEFYLLEDIEIDTFRIFSRQQDTIITQFSKQKKIITGECKLPIQIYKERLYFTQAFNNETYQISNQNKAKFPNIIPPFFQIIFENELNYKEMCYLYTKIQFYGI